MVESENPADSPHQNYIAKQLRRTLGLTAGQASLNLVSAGARESARDWLGLIEQMKGSYRQQSPTEANVRRRFLDLSAALLANLGYRPWFVIWPRTSLFDPHNPYCHENFPLSPRGFNIRQN